MKVLWFLRRRRPQHPNWRTAQRICAVITAFIQAEGEEHTIDDIAQLSGQSVKELGVVLSWMERLDLAHSYYPEPVIPGRPLLRLYFLTPKAYRWATEALLHGKTPRTDPTLL